MPRGLFWAIVCALLLIAFAAYLPTLRYEFVHDDQGQILANPTVQSPIPVLKYFTDYAWPMQDGMPASFFRPMFIFWLRLNYLLNGQTPEGWHLITILPNVLASALLGWLAWALLRSRAAVLVAIGYFALHPVHVESVAFISAVVDPLMCVFFFASLLLFLRYQRVHSEWLAAFSRSKPRAKRNQQKAEGSPRTVWLLGSAGCCLAALFTKETAIILPIVIFALALIKQAPSTPDAGSGKTQRFLCALRQSAPFAVVMAIYLVLRWYALGGRLSYATQQFSMRALLLTWPSALWFYVKALLWPVTERAFADSVMVESFSMQSVALPALGVIGVVAALALGVRWLWSKARSGATPVESEGLASALLIGLSLLILPLLLTMNLNSLLPGDFLHGRYCYLPSAGLALLLASAAHCAKAGVLIPTIMVTVTFVVFTFLTLQQEPIWADDLTLFTTAHRDAPRNRMVTHDYGILRALSLLSSPGAGDCRQTLPVFQELVKEDATNWVAWGGAGDCYVKANELEKAERAMERAATLSGNPAIMEDWQKLRKVMGK